MKARYILRLLMGVVACMALIASAAANATLYVYTDSGGTVCDGERYDGWRVQIGTVYYLKIVNVNPADVLPNGTTSVQIQFGEPGGSSHKMTISNVLVTNGTTGLVGFTGGYFDGTGVTGGTYDASHSSGDRATTGGCVTGPVTYGYYDRSKPHFDATFAPAEGSDNGGCGAALSNNGRGHLVYATTSSDCTDNGCTDCTPQGVLSGTKYYDTDMDGQFDVGELVLPGFVIHIHWTYNNVQHDATTTTDASGFYSFQIPVGSTFSINEDQSQFPPTGSGPNSNWIESGPANGSTNAGGSSALGFIWSGTLNADQTGLDFGNYLNAPIGGQKFYDANGNGIKDLGEMGIQGFRITITGTDPAGHPISDRVYTDASGNWTAGPYPVNSTITVSEVLPTTRWVQTFPAAGNYPGITVDGSNAQQALDFGNYCTNIGGLTLGFWSNKNGQALMCTTATGTTLKSGVVTLLNSLNLRKANGDPFTVTSVSGGYTAFRSWLLNATATNMAYMLSAQLAANELDTLPGLLNSPLDPGLLLVLTPAEQAALNLGSNFITLGALQQLAIDSLHDYGNTTAQSPQRDYQTVLKTILDRLNNNIQPVIGSGPCSVTYPP